MDLLTDITDATIAYDKSWLLNHQPPCQELDRIIAIMDAFIELRKQYKELCESSEASSFLVGHIDRIHAVLCADPHATWRERAIQAAEAVEELPTAKKLPKDDNNGWLPATEEFIKQLKTGDLVAYIDYKGTVGMLNWVLATDIENWTSTTKYMQVLDKPKESKADKFAAKLLSQFDADDQEAVLAMIKEEFGEEMNSGS
jgi:hypothetical protein